MKDRWAKPGWAATAQLMPLALIVGVLAMSATLMAPTSLTALVKGMFNSDSKANVTLPAPLPIVAMPQGTAAPAVPTGRVFSITAKQANLRTGPGNNYQLVSVLGQGTLVLVTETDPSGQWLRITTPDGANGFMAVSQLSPDVRMDALEEVGGFGKPVAPNAAKAPEAQPKP